MNDTLKELVKQIKARRVIPFIGSGLSATCGLPTWGTLINSLMDRFNIDPSDLDDNSDLLRIAEYLKIINGGEIGPIRSEIEKEFNQNMVDVMESEPHLLLVSLGAPIIYTTNYDNLIENVYKYLNLPYKTVITTRDIVNYGTSSDTQIVKFHGSFELEKTMVLTESDYFNRLEFESPVDIKLRADVLGKSILFMGYSFSDFNIRYLWFKLRKMMKGVNEREIPKSFIVLTESNRMMETLFQNIGILPINIWEFEGVSTTEKLCNFLETVIILLHSSELLDIPIVGVNRYFDKLYDAIQRGENTTAINYALLIYHSKFGEKQLAYLFSDEREINDNDLGLWFSLINIASPEVRKILSQALIRLESDYKIYELYNILTLSFLRYSEVRDVEANYEWFNFNMVIEGIRLNRKAEFQILEDALLWVTYSEELRTDTTLYYLLLISIYFKDRMAEDIFDPEYDFDNGYHSEPSDAKYHIITPFNVIEYMKKKANWLPEPEQIIENMDSFERILDSLGCTIQSIQFQWNSISISEKIKQVFDEVNK